MQLGTLSTGPLATIDDRGTVRADGLTVRWRVRPRDAWIDPGVDGEVRHTRVGVAPVAESALRIPGGDARAVAYAVDVAGGAIVVEIENASPNAIAVAFAVAATDRWVATYSARPGATEPDGAVVFPVPHRTRVRGVIAGESLDARSVPDAATVARGWDRILERGMTVELPEPDQTAVDAARVDVLLAPPSGATFAALEAWGFDEDAIAMWARLGLRERRAARRAAGAGALGAVRAALITEDERDRSVAAFPGFRTAWLGQSLAVHDAPMRVGRCSFAVRWHGARPALLWDVPDGVTVRAPSLDPSFVGTTARGETLLAEPPVELLLMGDRAPVGGASVDAPEEFS
jgi:hypothetical protein